MSHFFRKMLGTKITLAKRSPIADEEKCPVCSERMQFWVDGMYDDRYGLTGHYALIKCSSCGLLKTMPGLRESDLPDLYATYYPRRNIDPISLLNQMRDVATPLGRLKIWLSGVNNQGHYYALPKTRVLDYGCGVGTSLLELRAMGAEGYGIDPDPNIKRVAEYFGLKVHIGSLEENPFPDKRFDVISLNQVIEHVPEPGQLLRKLRERLEDNGMLILSFPNVDSIYRRLFGRLWINWHIPYHIFHFNRNSFRKLSERHGLRVIRHKTVTPNLWTMLQLRRLFVRPRMGVPSPLWFQAKDRASDKAGGRQSRRRPMIQSVHRIVRAITLLPVTAAIAFINRLIDALGMGDSLVVFVKPRGDTSELSR